MLQYCLLFVWFHLTGGHKHMVRPSLLWYCSGFWAVSVVTLITHTASVLVPDLAYFWWHFLLVFKSVYSIVLNRTHRKNLVYCILHHPHVKYRKVGEFDIRERKVCEVVVCLCTVLCYHSCYCHKINLTRVLLSKVDMHKMDCQCCNSIHSGVHVGMWWFNKY